MEKPEYIIIRDGLFRSFMADTYLFLLIIGTLAVNHYLFNDSRFGAITMGILIFMSVMGKTMGRTKKFQSDKEAIKWITDNK